MMLEIDKINELDALVSLIDEPNNSTYNEIREKVISYGTNAIPVLEEAWVNTLSETESERIEQLIDEIKYNKFVIDLENWKNSEDTDLLQGVIILSRFLQNQFDEDYLSSQFSKLARTIWLEMNENLTALEKIRVINHIIFGVSNFSNTSSLPYNVDSYFLNKLFNSKKGNPHSLGLLYIAIAQKLDIPVFGVNLPNNFIVVYMTNKKKVAEYRGEDVMFYINPANYGAVFTHNEIKSFIQQAGLNIELEYFLPQSNIGVLKRIVEELLVVSNNENNDNRIRVLNQINSII